MSSTFQKATRQSVKARIALSGPSGSGKTMTGLALCAGLADGGKVAVIDTEHGSASLFADRFDFDVLELGPPFDPARYVASIRAAEQEGYAAILVDSMSHAWFAEGGVLDIVDKAKARMGGSSFAAWSHGTPKQNALIDAVVNCRAHIVVTMRSKQEYVQEKGSDGKTSIRKVGLAPIQRDGVEYEFTLFGELTIDHQLLITKARALEGLQDVAVEKPGPEFGRRVLAELQNGQPSSSAGATGPVASVETEESADAGGASEAEVPAEEVFLITPYQMKRIHAIGKELGWDHDEIKRKLGVSKKDMPELTEDQAEKAIAWLEEQRAKARAEA
jgi:hypothetical protein